MAAISAVSRRKKQATYGKPSRSVNTWNSGNLDALDEDEFSVVEPTNSRPADVTKSYSVQKRATKPISPKAKPVKTREIKEDLWDVPSSESSEDEAPPVRRQAAPKFGGKGKSDKPQETVELAPWEKAKANVLDANRRDDLEESRRDKTEVTQEENRDVQSTDSPTNAGKEAVGRVASPVQSSPNTSSAAARLRARRLQSGHSAAIEAKKLIPSSKRSAQTGIQTQAEVRPQKRIRSDNTADDDVLMHDAQSPRCDSREGSIGEESHLEGTSGKLDSGIENVDIMTAPAKKTEPDRSTITRNRRGKVTMYSSPRKGVSAPARLSGMLPVDTTDDTQSPSTTGSRPNTPHRAGDACDLLSPQAAFRTNAGMKQSQLLSRLLPDDSVAPSPGALPMQALNISSARRGPRGLAARMLPKSSSDIGRPRTKLVDRLKASAPSSDEESSDGDSTGASDVDMRNAGESGAAASEQTQSQNLSQGTATTTNSRPKLTYAAAQRSWLKEETLEEELMLDMPSERQQRPALVTRHSLDTSNSASQKSTFDLEDSDDEGAAGRLRTIHELRAGGINRRFMDDISGLLEDIANHKSTARSRRRSALIDIATKLKDKAFAAKFYRQGFEQQLLAECIAPSDDVADIALAVVIVVIMAGDSPEHAAQSLKDGGALAMLTRMLSNRIDMRALAKERRNNMSKGAQSDFFRFIGDMTEQQSIWGELDPTLVTSRIISLKALDLLVGKLRRSGDCSEILNNDEIRLVSPLQSEAESSGDGEEPADVALSISVLESLSTTTVTLSWPAEVVERLRTMLSLPVANNDKAQKLRFLMLRLCLNLTNGNLKNCKVFARSDIIVGLLQSMADGFELLSKDQEESQRTISLDLLVLSMGIMINLTEQKSNACKHTATEDAVPLLVTLVSTFLRGQQHAFEAESVEDGVTNVAFGYLAVVLANLCRDREARHVIADKLPGQKLDTLVEAVHEFVVHHQKVDALNFEGDEGTAVWSAFTEKLKGVLSRLSAEAEADEIDRLR